MRWILVPAVAILALGGVAGCGDDDGGSGGGTPEEATACLEEQGLEVAQKPGSEEIGVTSALEVAVSDDNVIIVNFFESSDGAADYAEGEAAFLGGAGGGAAEAVDNVTVGVARPGAEEEFATVKECVGG